jgi:acylphosphatase
VRRRYNFYGRVQGVGFRYKAKYTADSLRLTGWVRNEYDGSVTMEVQGKEEIIDQLILSIKRDRYIDVTDMNVKIISEVEDERTFKTKY